MGNYMNRGLFRSLGIDPGSRNLGYAVSDIDMIQALRNKFLTNVEHMDSVLVDQIVRVHESRWYGLTERQRRLKSCGLFAVGLVDHFDPDVVILEDAYLNRRQPLSYRSLSEGLIYLVDAIHEFDPTIPIIIIEAMKAKKAVGAKPKRGDDQKKIVKEAILKNKAIVLPKNFKEKSEHSIDAVALSHFGCIEWWEENCAFYE